MFRVFNCLTSEHDWRLVVLAGLVCLLASLVAVSLFHRACATSGRARRAWLSLTGAATGCGIWATHFIAMLAYEPSVAVAYDLWLTGLSLIVAMAITVLGFAVAASSASRWAPVIGGSIIGAGVAGMHYTGMWALELPGHVSWSKDLVLASILSGIVFGAAALTAAVHNSSKTGAITAAALLTLAIVSHHFTAMAAVQIVPDPTLTFARHVLSPPTLALAVAGAAIAILSVSLVGAIADSRLSIRTQQFARARQQLIDKSEERLRQQNVWLDTALNNMTQGLCMFDANEEIVVFNRRFMEMYKLSPQVVRPGCKLRELIRHRKEVGLLDSDPELYYRDIMANVRAGKTISSLVKTTDGRLIQASTQPMSGNGWVTTHEDVTERRQAEERIREQKLQLDTALNNMSQGLNMFDASGRLVVCNERYLQMYGLSADKVKPGCTVGELVDARIKSGTFFAADPQQYTSELLEAMNKREPASVTMDLPDGRVIAVNSQPTPDGSGWVVTHEDITERRRTEMERDRSQALANIVIENVPSTIVVKDARTLRYVLVNRAGEEYYGIPRETMIGKVTAEIFAKEEADIIAEHDQRLLDSGEPQFYDERPVTTPGGHRRIATTTRMPIRDQKGQMQYLLTMVDDRTHRKRAEAQIARLVHYDALTDLPNRAAFAACIDATIDAGGKNGQSFALMSLDFDEFKEVNDVYGHRTGDELLRHIAKRLQAVVGGAFVARLGGDEFVVIASDGDQPAAAETLAERILIAIGKRFDINGHSVTARVSMGIAIFPVDGTDSATLIGNADAALYRAKTEGRGMFRFFEATMDQRLRDRRMLQQKLHSAIERNELLLHYQPQARIDGEVTGFETLLRWQHPEHGIISPSTFVPLAEESGLIVAMGEWVMREACREAASWASPLSIALNLSPAQFRHGDLPGLVHTVLLETGLHPSRLELEITEGVLIDDFSRALSILRRLKALGVRIAMDDFGTGYSSLSYLQSFPFDKIKIDQAFITNLERNGQSATIVRAVIGLARGLELPVLAEGVETQEQLAFLARESCDEVQGYLIGEPRPIADYAAWTAAPGARSHAAKPSPDAAKTASTPAKPARRRSA